MTKVVDLSVLLGSICAFSIALPGSAGTQEVKSASGSAAQTATITPVSQKELENAARDSSNFLHTNGNYDQTRFYPNGRSIAATSRIFTPPGSSRRK